MNGQNKRLSVLEARRFQDLGERLDTLARANDFIAEDWLESLATLLAMTPDERIAYLRALWDEVQEPETPTPEPLPSNGHSPMSTIVDMPDDEPTTAELDQMEAMLADIEGRLPKRMS